jgi:hypothetical protein
VESRTGRDRVVHRQRYIELRKRLSWSSRFPFGSCVLQYIQEGKNSTAHILEDFGDAKI